MTDETVLVAKPFDIAEYLTDNETIEAFLNEMLGNGDPRYLAEALGAIARARGGMTDLSRKTGITREALYRALSATGNPELGTILKVMQALGIRLTASINPATSGPSNGRNGAEFKTEEVVYIPHEAEAQEVANR